MYLLQLYHWQSQDHQTLTSYKPFQCLQPHEMIPSPTQTFNPPPADWDYCSPNPPPYHFPFHEGITPEGGAACLPDSVLPWIKSERPNSIGDDSDGQSDNGSVTFDIESHLSPFANNQPLPDIKTLLSHHQSRPANQIAVVPPRVHTIHTGVHNPEKRRRGRPRKPKLIKPSKFLLLLKVKNIWLL